MRGVFVAVRLPPWRPFIFSPLCYRAAVLCVDDCRLRCFLSCGGCATCACECGAHTPSLPCSLSPSQRASLTAPARRRVPHPEACALRGRASSPDEGRTPHSCGGERRGGAVRWQLNRCEATCVSRRVSSFPPHALRRPPGARKSRNVHKLAGLSSCAFVVFLISACESRPRVREGRGRVDGERKGGGGRWCAWLYHFSTPGEGRQHAHAARGNSAPARVGVCVCVWLG